jgi:hypothetical protein
VEVIVLLKQVPDTETFSTPAERPHFTSLLFTDPKTGDHFNRVEHGKELVGSAHPCICSRRL